METPKHEQLDPIEEQLKGLQENLGHLYNLIPEEDQNRWYDLQTEVECGQNRQAAIAAFIDFLNLQADKLAEFPQTETK